MSAATKHRQHRREDVRTKGINDTDAADDLFSIADCNGRNKYVLKGLRGGSFTAAQLASEKRRK